MELIKIFLIIFILLTTEGCNYLGIHKNSDLPLKEKSIQSSSSTQPEEFLKQEEALKEQFQKQIRIITPDQDYTIGPEDVLRIQVWDNPDLERKVQVSREGTFSFPLIGNVKASGLTVAQLEAELIKRLADGYIINPHVTITIEEYKDKKVFVLGEVQRPGTYPLTGKTNLLDIIAQAGGLTKEASDELIVIRPQNQGKKETPTLPEDAVESEIIRINLYNLMRGDFSLNIEILKGDTLFVPKMSYFYVYGEVNKPGRYPLEKGTTVLKGITMAGGLTEKASKWRTKIIREKNGVRIEKRAKMDQLLEPEDIISVPESFF